MSVEKLLVQEPNRHLSVHLIITTRCNNNCKRCLYRWQFDYELPLNQARSLFSELRRKGTRFISLGGGEPTTHPELRRIVSLAKRQGFKVSMTTNGLNLVKANYDRVHISFDTMHPISRQQLIKAANFYKQLGAKVGINHVLTSEESLRNVYRICSANQHLFDSLLVMLLKPNHSLLKSQLGEIKALLHDPPKKLKDKLLIDPCSAYLLGFKARCIQGIYSCCLVPTSEGVLEYICSNQPFVPKTFCPFGRF